METIVRAAVIYVALLVIFRIMGQRSLSQITTFDFVLLLIISEAIQNGLVGQSYSVTNALLLILTLVGIDLALSELKQHSPRLEKWMEGLPVILVDEGRLLHDRMNKARVDESDILTAARQAHGLERLEQIKYAVLESSGGISIVPWDDAARAGRERPAA
jgi:uncharacterized membrane protein YcaP (DUF421 family)